MQPLSNRMQPLRHEIGGRRQGAKPLGYAAPRRGAKRDQIAIQKLQDPHAVYCITGDPPAAGPYPKIDQKSGSQKNTKKCPKGAQSAPQRVPKKCKKCTSRRVLENVSKQTQKKCGI